MLALGGSTNAIVHLIAMARRAGVELDARPTSTRSRARRRCSPTSGPRGKYLMEDFYYAGGLRALLAQPGRPARLDALTVNGRTLGENIDGAKVFNDDVIRRRDKPLVAPTTASRCCAATSRPTAR